jgi:type VI secretion system protein ImpK
MLPLLARIGDALAAIPGRVLVTGHTDGTPIRSARFPSNWHLSQARARAVAQTLAAKVPAGRMVAEGRADAEPIAANDTATHRARNRRVEISVATVGHVPPGMP